MARFRATLKGQRGETSRLGSPNSGLRAYVNGWNAGVTVEAEASGTRDVFYVYATGGSNGEGTGELVAVITRDSVTGKRSLVTFDKNSHASLRAI